MTSWRRRVRRGDDGAIAVLYAIVLAGVLVPVMGLAVAAGFRSASADELHRAADSGALAAAAAIPFGDVDFALGYLDGTSNGATSWTLTKLRLKTYDQPDPLQVACDIATDNATARSTVAHDLASGFHCDARYLPDLDLLASLASCGQALTGTQPVGLPPLPNLAPLLPALLRPGVQVDLSWHMTTPTDRLFGSAGQDQQVTSIARRRFKDIVVVPEADVATQTALVSADATINLNPVAGDVRTVTLDALQGTEDLLRQRPQTAVCADVLAAARDDILDAVDPPAHGPQATQILDDALSTQSPILVARVIQAANSLSVPYLDFVPVCVDYVHGQYVGHLTAFGSCDVNAPGAFRASLRRS